MITRYYSELLHHFTRFMNDRDSAADLVQEAYLRLLTQQRDGRPAAQPRALLFRIGRKLLIDGSCRRAVHGEAGPQGESGCDPDTIAADRASEPEAAASSSEAVQSLLNVIACLPRRRREAFILNRFECLPRAEVAARMGISLKTVAQHIHQAMQACRRCRESHDVPASFTSPARANRDPARLPLKSPTTCISRRTCT